MGHERLFLQKRITCAYMWWVSSGEYIYPGTSTSFVRHRTFGFFSSVPPVVPTIFIASPLGSSGISSRLVYIQARPRPQIYDSVYRVAVVSCAWDSGRKRFGGRPRSGYQNGTQIRCKKLKRAKTVVSLRN